MKHWWLLLGLVSFNAFSALTVGTYNIRNFDYDERARISTDKAVLEKTLKSFQFDLLGVNEINNTQEFERFIETKFPQYEVQLSTCGGAHGQRLGFVFNKSKLRLISYEEDLSVTDPGGSNPGCYAGSRPLAIAYFEELATGEKFHHIQVHLKAGSNADAHNKRFKQYQIIEKKLKDMMAKGFTKIVMSGDFNTTGYLDRNEDHKRFTQMIQNAGMINTSAALPCSAYWWGGTDDGIETPSLLDHVIASADFMKNKGAKSQVHAHCKQVSCSEAAPETLGATYQGVSDHCPQTVTAR